MIFQLVLLGIKQMGGKVQFKSVIGFIVWHMLLKLDYMPFSNWFVIQAQML